MLDRGFEITLDSDSLEPDQPAMGQGLEPEDLVVPTAASLEADPGGFDSIPIGFDPDSTYSPLNVLDPEIRRIHEDSILKVGHDLALVQALNPNERDEVGFSNADFPLAFRLVASENVPALASLLLLYPDQSKARGLDLDIVRSLALRSEGGSGGGGLGKLAGGPGERSLVRESLKQTREVARGELGWSHAVAEGVVLMGGVGIPFEAKSVLRQVALPGGPAGVFRIPMERLPVAVARLEKLPEVRVERWNDLKDLVATCPPPSEASMMDDLMAAMDPSLAVMSATLNNGSWSVNWTNPFSAEGVRVRELVRPLAGTFDGRTKSYPVPDGLQVHRLLRKLENEPGVVIAGFAQAVGAPSPEVEDLLERADIISLRVLRTEPEGVVVQVSGYGREGFGNLYNKPMVELSRSVGGSFLGDEKANLIPWYKVKDYLAGAETMPDVEAFEVAAAYREHLEGVVENLKNRVALVDTLTPTGIRLFPYQVEDAEFAIASRFRTPGLKGTYLTHEQGLGKTLIAGMVAEALTRDIPNGGRIMVVVPTHLKPNWPREIRKFFGDQTIQVINDAKATVRPDARFTVVSYSLLNKLKDQLIDANFDVCLIDESHYMKESTTTWTQALLGVRKKGVPPVPGILDQIPNVFPMTGTPKPNGRSKELFNPLAAINHPVTRRGFFPFGMEYCAGQNTGWGMDFDGNSKSDELGEAIADGVCDRRKQDTLDLPPKMYRDFEIELPAEAMKEYRTMFLDLLKGYRANGMSNGAETLQKINAMRQATSLAKVDSTNELVDGITSRGGKALVFTNFLAPMDRFMEHYGNRAVRIDGSMSADERMAAVDLFQDDASVQVCIAQTKAGGTGYNMTVAQDCVIHDPNWNRGVESQCTDRLHRIGQTGTVTVHRPLAVGTLDPFMFQMNERKAADGAAIDVGLAAGADPETATASGLLSALMKELDKAESLESAAKKPRAKVKKAS